MEELYADTFKEAMGLVNDNRSQEEKAEDIFTVFSGLLLSIINDFTPLTRIVLGDLVGIDLLTDDNLYDYLKKSYKIDRIKAVELGMTMFAEVNINDLDEMLKKLMEGVKIDN